MITLKKKLYRFKQASLVFKMTRDYSAKWLRFVCRYHLYIKEGDYSLRYAFEHPKSRKEFIKLIEHQLQEIEQVFYGSFFDKREHYDGCKLYLKCLHSFAIHYPLLFFVRFRLRF